MKANELMIGDWVLCDNTPYQIAEIGGMVCISFEQELFAALEDIQPIPLTAGILEKNGFENDFYEEESIADYHTIRLEGYSLKHNIGEIDGYLITWCNGSLNVTTDFHGCVQKEIAYVHELQHALRLCGIEKEIAL